MARAKQNQNQIQNISDNELIVEQNEVHFLTQEGLDKIRKELDDRRDKKRSQIADDLEQATEQGDLSENSAYKKALEEKELNESKIEELEKIVANVEIIDDNASTHTATMGNKVLLKILPGGKKAEYTLVGKSEANPSQGLISIDSPLGKALHNKKVGEQVEIELPLNKIKYVIEEIK